MTSLGASYAIPLESGGMGKPVARQPEAALAALIVVSVVVLLLAMPSWATAGVAVVAAASWCYWLDRHPTT